MSSHAYSDHQRLDARSLALHCLVAEKLLANPALIAQARATLARLRTQTAEPVLPSYFVEWERVLAGGSVELAAFLTSTSEDAAGARDRVRRAQLRRTKVRWYPASDRAG